MDDIGDGFGTASIFVFLAMFGGSTFILFLLCYFCQKKLQYGEDMAIRRDHSTPARQVFVIPSIPNQQPFRRSELSLPTPPPEYHTVVKKDYIIPHEDDPPPYDIAIASDVAIKEQPVTS